MSDAAVEALVIGWLEAHAMRPVSPMMLPLYEDLVDRITTHTADLTARLASAEEDIQKAVDSAVQPWKEVDAAHRRDIDTLKAAVEQARQTVLDHEKGCTVIDPRCLRVIADAITSRREGDVSFSWEEEALRYAKNTDYWRERAEKAEAALEHAERALVTMREAFAMSSSDEENRLRVQLVEDDRLIASLRTRLAEAEQHNCDCP